MKKYFFKLGVLFLSALMVLTFTSCEDDGDDGGEQPPLVEDGWYASGSATADASYAISTAQMVDDKDYNKSAQNGMSYGIYYLVAGDLSFRKVLGNEDAMYGVSNVADSTQSDEAGEEFAYKTGMLDMASTTKLTIAEAGLYYIILDATNSYFWVMRINNFELSANGALAVYESGSAEGATFKATGVELRTVTKVRMNTAWKILAPNTPFDAESANPEDFAKPVISYGGTMTDMTADGGDITIENGGKLLDITFTWNPEKKGIAGIVITTEEGDDLPAAQFPEKLYMTGASVGNGAWDWTTNAVEFIPVNSQPHLFWNVQWLEPGVTDAGFKISTELDWGPAFGVDPASVANGVYTKGSENVPEVATAGYYNVVVNLETETIEVNPAMIYGLGDAYGGYDAAVAANIFVENTATKVLVSPATTADGNYRMHITSTTMTNAEGDVVDWWQAELNVIDGKIEYRGTGGDQAAVPTTTGQVVTLDFVAGTGTIQ